MYMLLSPVISGFKLPNFTQVPLQPSSSCSWHKLHPLTNDLTIVLAGNCSSWLGKKASVPKWGQYKVRGNFSTHSCKRGEKWAIQCQPRQSNSNTAMLILAWQWTHPLPFVLPFLPSKGHGNYTLGLVVLWTLEFRAVHRMHIAYNQSF